MTNFTTPSTQAPEQYLIRKGGAFYRPNAAGYTMNVAEAGRYSLEDAIRHSHPNGPNGPRDGIDYLPAPPRQVHPIAKDALREALADIFAAWDAHVLAVDLINSAREPLIDVLTVTTAERGVYDERYRASEKAKREWYRAMHRFIDNPATRAAVTDAGEGK